MNDSPVSMSQSLRDLCCFKEAFSRARDDLATTTIRWQDFPGLSADPIGDRHQAMTEGKKGRVSFDPAVRRMMKTRFPTAPAGSAIPETIAFHEPLSSVHTVVVRFEKRQLWGMGKAFEIKLGMARGNDISFDADHLTDLFAGGHGPASIWTYGSADELGRALEGVGELLAQALPVLKSQCAEVLSTRPTVLVPEALSAREAFARIGDVVRDWSDDALLTNVQSGPIGTGGYEGATLNLTGRLAPHGAWCFYWSSPRRAEDLLATVGAMGTPQIRFRPTLRTNTAVDSNWCDSTRLLETARIAGVTDERASERLSYLGINYGTGVFYGGRPAARVASIFSGADRRRDVHLWCDPVTAEKFSLEER